MPVAASAQRLLAVSRLLGASFLTDPMWATFLPDPDRRAAAVRAVYTLVARYGDRFGEVATDEGLDAVAVWLPSERAQPTLWDEVRCGGLGVALALGPARCRQLMRMNDELVRARLELTPQPHRYLWALAVRPDRQGQGRGSRLLTDGLAAADREGRATYLETFSARNVRLYERHGFEVRRTASMHPGGTPWWSMVRRPSPSPPSP